MTKVFNALLRFKVIYILYFVRPVLSMLRYWLLEYTLKRKEKTICFIQGFTTAYYIYSLLCWWPTNVGVGSGTLGNVGFQFLTWRRWAPQPPGTSLDAETFISYCPASRAVNCSRGASVGHVAIHHWRVLPLLSASFTTTTRHNHQNSPIRVHALNRGSHPLIVHVRFIFLKAHHHY